MARPSTIVEAIKAVKRNNQEIKAMTKFNITAIVRKSELINHNLNILAKLESMLNEESITNK